MDVIASKLTILFEEPFWIGVYERRSCGQYEVCKITFGAEPKDYEVYELLLKNWNTLRFSPPMEVAAETERRVNPKRMQRLVKSQMDNAGIGTRAQQALKLQQEQGKTARKAKAREQRQAKKERQFDLRQEKQKAKHRGH